MRLAPRIYEMQIVAPMVVHEVRPGQFMNIIVHEKGKSVPLTIADLDRTHDTITIVFQAVGVSTMRLAIREVGDRLFSIRGPLGQPSNIELFSKPVLCVAGGVGIAPMYPVARAFKEAGNTVFLIVGARTEELLFWEDKIRDVVDDIVVCTDGGRMRDRRGSVLQPLRVLLRQKNMIIKNGGSRAHALRWLAVDALAPVLGIFATLLFAVPEAQLGLLLALFSGFFLYIGATDLIPESYHAHPARWTTIATVLGVATLYAVIRLAGI